MAQAWRQHVDNRKFTLQTLVVYGIIFVSETCAGDRIYTHMNYILLKILILISSLLEYVCYVLSETLRYFLIVVMCFSTPELKKISQIITKRILDIILNYT